eukprot:TRINITY_DN2743_c0_g1_i2.p1 TRINITY_DN2743_c0_g1~~TRINITY_DN2743_c0_g1_i2.p1  ORF type:complete len:105 (-),score=10.69 TRINITY_DN2743_c0_g1_i2:42-356(-)
MSEVSLTLSELSKYDGSDPSLPVYVSIRGNIYDVTSGPYSKSKGAGYSVFAGKEIARPLAISSVKPEDITPSIEDLTEKQMETLQKWEETFSKKYKIVGKTKDE